MGYSYGGNGGEGNSSSDYDWLLYVMPLVLLVVGLLAVALWSLAGNVTLFEDGSVQLFNQPGWGLCVIRSWGCA